jgi:hypothetical protein
LILPKLNSNITQFADAVSIRKLLNNVLSDCISYYNN